MEYAENRITDIYAGNSITAPDIEDTGRDGYPFAHIDFASDAGAWADFLMQRAEAGICTCVEARNALGEALPANRTRWPSSILTPTFVQRTVEMREGRFFWRVRQDSYFYSERTRETWNLRNAGKPIKTRVNSAGYEIATICQVPVGIHRLVWLLRTGGWPVHIIDHIDGNPLNNAFENLRDVPHAINSRNMKPRTDGKRPGVNWDATRRRWVALGGRKTLGRFVDYASAVACREAFEVANGYTRRGILPDMDAQQRLDPVEGCGDTIAPASLPCSLSTHSTDLDGRHR